MALPQRRRPIGAEILPSGEVHFRVWAPRRRTVDVSLEGVGSALSPLRAEGGGYFSGPTYMRAGYREGYLATARDGGFGGRCARTP